MHCRDIAPPPLNRRQALTLTATGLASLLLPHLASAAAGDFVYGSDIHGRAVTTLGAPGIRYIAAIFVATDCPIANRYLPLLSSMATQFSPQGMRFWLVYPNPGDTLAAVRAHLQMYPGASSLPQLIAPDPRFIAQADVHVTPEAALFHAGQVMTTPALWHGRIDDRYVSFGVERPAAARHDLADAIHAVLAGHAPILPAAPPVGCAIVVRA